MPAPSRPPTKLCVVEIGKLKREANNTVIPAPKPMAIRKLAVPATSTGTKPLPEKLATNP